MEAYWNDNTYPSEEQKQQQPPTSKNEMPTKHSASCSACCARLAANRAGISLQCVLLFKW